MSRVVNPLFKMGAHIESTEGKGPLSIQGIEPGNPGLKGIRYAMPVASAQLKSCLLLAGLYADGPSTILEIGPSRDHTERMLSAMGASIVRDTDRVVITPPDAGLAPFNMAVPGDMSSAAFLLTAGAIVPGSEITIGNVGVNPTRFGIVSALNQMGAAIDITNPRDVGGEPVADLRVGHSTLSSATFGGDSIVAMIDELPVLAVAATQAHGTTVIRDARELRVKETDRIACTAAELNRLGARITPLEDGMAIEGPTPLRGTEVKSHGDHRLAMLLTIAGLVATGRTNVQKTEVTADSFPGFEACLTDLGAPIQVVRT